MFKVKFIKKKSESENDLIMFRICKLKILKGLLFFNVFSQQKDTIQTNKIVKTDIPL
jgi:hypothetical protein